MRRPVPAIRKFFKKSLRVAADFRAAVSGKPRQTPLPGGRRPPVRCFPALFLSCVALAIAGCTKRETPVEAGIRTQTLLIGNLAEPRDLDPHIVTAATDSYILAALFEGLTVLDEQTSKPLPGTADHWEISADGLVYTFHLRPGARWSNGDPVTARDFAYSFQRMLTPALGSEYSYMLWVIKNAEAYNSGKLTDFSAVGIAAPDDAILRLTLERPTPYLLALAAHATWMPVHRATIEKFGRMDQRSTAWTRPGHLVSNGPFTLAEWSPNARIVVDKNPRYWDAAHTHLNHIVFFPIESADVEEHNFRAGQMHVTYDLPASKIAVYRQQNPGELRIDPLLNTLYLNFNTTKPPLNNPKVRRALALAIDREAISRNVFQGAWPALHSFTPPNCGGYTPRAGVPDAARRTRQLRRHVLHADLPEVRVGHRRQVPASFEVQVFEGIANVIHRSRRGLGLGERLQHFGSGARFDPLLEDGVDFGGVSRPGPVIGKPLVRNELRLPDGSARPLEDALPAARDCQPPLVRSGEYVSRRREGKPRTEPFGDDTELVVFNEYMAENDHKRLINGQVDMLAQAAYRVAFMKGNHHRVRATQSRKAVGQSE